MKRIIRALVITIVFISSLHQDTMAADEVPQWGKFEYKFTSDKLYSNVMYDLKKMTIRFVSPAGRVKNINAFWDGDKTWKVRFSPDETGEWSWESFCSDEKNQGLHKIKGTFICKANSSPLDIYKKGAVIRPKASYHLAHSDGTPFFWAACTAWNGTLKSTDQEWKEYLSNRVTSGYNVIQFVTTQWRGGDKNSLGQVAFEGSGRITINPEFFRHLDGKIDEINKHGLVAAPVLLWALASVQGRELSPGYYLPDHEAALLAKYMVARYGANHVIWILGGDGKYTDEFEQRWKNIGRAVFAEEHPGPVALHPGGGSWIGEVYANEDWLDIVGYQSGHNRSVNAINFMTRGPVSKMWDKLPPRVLINMEPVYEEMSPDITAMDVRNAGYWSIFSGPVAGISYGANGVWPWLRDGEVILNHAYKGEKASRWYKAIDLPGSKQTGYLAQFVRTLDWWNLRPSPGLLVTQPGDSDPRQFVSIVQSTDGKTVVLYLPKNSPAKIYNPLRLKYVAEWFDPVTNKMAAGKLTMSDGLLEVAPAGNNDIVVVLKTS